MSQRGGAPAPGEPETIAELLKHKGYSTSALKNFDYSALSKDPALQAEVTHYRTMYAKEQERSRVLDFQDFMLTELVRDTDDPLARPTFDGASLPPAAEVAEAEAAKVRVAQLIAKLRDDLLPQLAEKKRQLTENGQAFDAELTKIAKDVRSLTTTSALASSSSSSSVDKSIILEGKIAERLTELPSDKALPEELERLRAKAAERAATKQKVLQAISAAKSNTAAAEQEIVLLEQEEIDAMVHADLPGGEDMDDDGDGGDGGGGGATGSLSDIGMDVQGWTDDELRDEIAENEKLHAKTAHIGPWFKESIASVSKIGGVTLVTGPVDAAAAAGGSGAGAGSKQPPQLVIVLEFGQGVVLRVGLRRTDGSVVDVQLQQSGNGKSNSGGGGGGGGAAAVITLQRLEDIIASSKALVAPEGVRFLAREVKQRMHCENVRAADIKQMQRKFSAVKYRETFDELCITLPEGIVANFQLSRDYPLVPGGAWLLSLSGVGGWSEAELAAICQRVNAASAFTLDDIMTKILKEVRDLEQS